MANNSPVNMMSHITNESESNLTPEVLRATIIYNETDLLKQLLSNRNSHDVEVLSNGLILAASLGLDNMCRLLLDNNALINWKNTKYPHPKYLNALEAASLNGHNTTVSLLLKQNAATCMYDPSKPVDLCAIPMMTSFYNEDAHTFKVFLDHFENSVEDVPYGKLLHECIEEDNEKCAGVILFQNPGMLTDPISSDEYESYFHLAAIHGSVNIMTLIMNANSFRSLQDNWLVDKKIPIALQEHPEFLEHILEKRKQCVPLQQGAKVLIRNQIQPPNHNEKIDSLQLPPGLKRGISLRDMREDLN